MWHMWPKGICVKNILEMFLFLSNSKEDLSYASSVEIKKILPRANILNSQYICLSVD